MDGRGRAKDNIWIERFWKTINYEYIYILPEENGAALYTQTTDVEIEVNGLMTYDRKVIKIDEEAFAEINRSVILSGPQK